MCCSFVVTLSHSAKLRNALNHCCHFLEYLLSGICQLKLGPLPKPRPHMDLSCINACGCRTVVCVMCLHVPVINMIVFCLWSAWYFQPHQNPFGVLPKHRCFIWFPLLQPAFDSFVYLNKNIHTVSTRLVPWCVCVFVCVEMYLSVALSCCAFICWTHYCCHLTGLY